MKHGGKYPAKLMLVGEYGVVIGGSALTMPFRTFHARVRSVEEIPSGKEQEARQSLAHLDQLFGYIQGLPAGAFHAQPDLKLFSENLQDYWMDLDIPIGFGLGSSGAISAAIYDLFFPDSQGLSLQHQKEDLATIESYFHGKSSGVDALTCHAGSALRFHSSGHIERVNFDPKAIPGDYRFFLLNSQARFDTGPLVNHFLDRMKEKDFRRAMEEEYLPLNQLLIESLLGEKEADPAMLVRMVSDFQLQHFPKMIPENMLELWIEGLVSNVFYLKLNGSGGGFMLGIAHGSFREDLDERWGQQLLWIE
jgi:mevalonate kinase